jgi:membrane-bound metal-dependent hydrolase YbcI (DUF457 family)
MDTVTHGIVGALIGKALFAEDPSQIAPTWRETPRTVGRVAIISCTLGAIFPDIDVFAGPLAHNDLAMISWHRSITHSLIMLPVWTVVLAAITFWLAGLIEWPSPTFGTLTAIYAIGLASHVFLDLITSFGTMIWSPLDYSRPAWDWVFIVDVTLTSFALMPQLAAWAFQRPKRVLYRTLPLWLICSAAAFTLIPIARHFDVEFDSGNALGASLFFAGFFLLPLRHGTGTRVGRGKWCRIGLAFVSLYLASAATIHHSAVQQVSQFADDAHLNIQSIGALPLPPSIAHWSGLVSTSEGVYRLQFDEFSGDPVMIRFFKNADFNSYVVAARNLPDVQKFLWFSRFPLFEYSDLNGQPVVRITDMRFYGVGAPTSLADAPNDIETSFTYQVIFTPDGRVAKQGLLKVN